MFDIKIIRDNPEAFDVGLARRGIQGASETILKMDQELRKVCTDFQRKQARRNEASRMIGEAMRNKDNATTESLKSEVLSLKEDMEKIGLIERHMRTSLNLLLQQFPNIPADDVPFGVDEGENVVVRKVGEPKEYIFKPQDHVSLGEKLGIDFESGAKLSGSRFVVLKGQMARLERALIEFMIDHNREFMGFELVSVPYLVRADALVGTGQLPKFEDDLFKTTGDNPYYLIPTAEVSLTNLVRDQILKADDLPLRLTAATPCFRSEAGAAGRDTRGMIRQHQFTKVEMVSIVPEDQSDQELEMMVKCAGSILSELELPYRQVLLCTGDMGFSARKTYDLEVWLPSQNSYREISSCSNCGEFQARRMNTRGQNGMVVHTLNGSGLAVGRTIVALLENHQQEDGSIYIPEVLRPYMGGDEFITPVGQK